jgi:hypothetical protein
MVHKVFTSGDGEELSIYKNISNQLCIRIENREQKEDVCIFLCVDDANELGNELNKLIDIINEKDREPF